VKSKAKKGADKTKDGAEKVYDKTKDGSKAGYQKTKSGGKKAVEGTKKGAEKTGEAVTDGWISTRIHADMVNEDTLKGSDVHVDVKEHVVTLTGTVMSEAGRARAVQIAKGTKGVSNVIDRLTVGPKR
jgi:osmotically-inducible protein OsmY